TNSLFGDMAMPEIATPKIPPAPEWTLTELLDHEKEVTGIFISGHPLDNYRFEMQYYGLHTIVEFTEFKESIHLQPIKSRLFRLAGLITDVQLRLTKKGNQFAIVSLEDYTGNAEFAFFGEDYVRFKDYFIKGAVVYLTGGFKNRFNQEDNFEFKVQQIMLLESLKKTQTRQVQIDMKPDEVTPELIDFFENNMKKYPGKTSIRFNIYDRALQAKVSLNTLETGLEMNDEMTEFLNKHPYLEVKVVTA
ncbi:MAG TPA: OB-fold nucleic acid binding domain-containing protein, partial [Parasegetibacter sp.]